jgi:hypothetical protein
MVLDSNWFTPSMTAEDLQIAGLSALTERRYSERDLSS